MEPAKTERGLSIYDKIKIIESHVESFKDFPRPKVLFRDIFSALRSGRVCKLLKEVFIEYIQTNHKNIDAVIGLDARGFLFAFTIASELEIGCIPVRKIGKLPGKTAICEYKLEYRSDICEVQVDSFKTPGLKCLIVDDLIATGGSMAAAITLAEEQKAEVVGCLVVMEIVSMEGKKQLPRNIPFHSFIKY